MPHRAHHTAMCPFAALLIGGSIAAGPPEITVLVLEGDLVPGVGLVTSISNIAVNNAGEWLVEADTDHPDTDADSVLLRDSVLDWREGDAVAAPNGATLDSFDSVTLNDLGHSGYNFFLDGTQGINDDSGVYGFFQPGSQPFDGTVLVVQESEAAPGLSEGTPFIGFFDVKVNNAGQLWVVASVDDPNIATSVDRAIYLLETDPDTGGISDFLLLAAEGDVFEDQVEPVADFGTGPHASAFNDNGLGVYFVDLAGDTSVDGAIYADDGVDRLLRAQEGSASPVKGRLWSSLSSPELDVNNAGDYVYSGTLDGDPDTASLLVRNNVKFRQEGDVVPGLAPGGFVLTTFGSGPLEINDGGGVLWYGDWNDPNTDVDTGLFLDDTLLVQEGVTTLAGSVVDIVRGVEDGYHMSNNGAFVIFEAVLLDGREGAFLISFGAPCPWDCDDGNGAVGTADLLALLSQWGGPGSCDLDGGGVSTSDLLELLSNWGPCP